MKFLTWPERKSVKMKKEYAERTSPVVGYICGHVRTGKVLSKIL
jgi:hypothetical protein